MSTGMIAAGKVRVAHNKGELAARGRLIDGRGRPTRDPEALFADPPGALHTAAGHKGYGLSLFVEVLAGALTGGGSSHPDNPTADRPINNMLSILIDPERMAGSGGDRRRPRAPDALRQGFAARDPRRQDPAAGRARARHARRATGRRHSARSQHARPAARRRALGRRSPTPRSSAPSFRRRQRARASGRDPTEAPDAGSVDGSPLARVAWPCCEAGRCGHVSGLLTRRTCAAGLPRWNAPGSATEATMPLARTGPTPGISISRRPGCSTVMDPLSRVPLHPSSP